MVYPQGLTLLNGVSPSKIKKIINGKIGGIFKWQVKKSQNLLKK